MAAGKIVLQANDGKTLSLVAPEGMSANRLAEITGTVTVTPVLTIASSVNESASIQGSYTSDTGSDVTISATLGTISNHNTTAKTFTYIAHDIIDGNDDAVVISAFATKAGELKSLTTTANVNVVFVSTVIDTNSIIQVVDFTAEAETNTGFDLI